MNPLLWILQFVFGCRHRHRSRVFTIKRRTYRVCFDCGQEFELPYIANQFRDKHQSMGSSPNLPEGPAAAQPSR